MTAEERARERAGEGCFLASLAVALLVLVLSFLLAIVNGGTRP